MATQTPDNLHLWTYWDNKTEVSALAYAATKPGHFSALAIEADFVATGSSLGDIVLRQRATGAIVHVLNAVASEEACAFR